MDIDNDIDMIYIEHQRRSISSEWFKVPLPPSPPSKRVCDICDKSYSRYVVIECDDGMYRCGRCRNNAKSIP